MKASLTAIATALVVICSVPVHVQKPQAITINYPTKSGASWPSFIAKEGGYYQKHGLDVTLVFAGHPAGIAMVVSGEAQMSSYNLESVMQASAIGSVIALASRDTYASMPCVSVSTPTAAVSPGGIESDSSKSTSATAGRRCASSIIIFTSRAVSVITVTFVTSLPVPAVVGIATSGTPACGTLCRPM